MKCISATALLLFSCVQIQAWVARQKFDPNDPFQNSSSHCYGLSYNIGDMKEGETKRAENACVKVHCKSDRSISLTGCGKLATTPPCYVDNGDLTKPHPECCPKEVCPE